MQCSFVRGIFLTQSPPLLKNESCSVGGNVNHKKRDIVISFQFHFSSHLQVVNEAAKYCHRSGNHTHKHTHSYSLTHPHRSPSLSHSLSCFASLSLPLSLSSSPSLSHTRTHTRTLSLSFSLSLSLFLFLFLSFSLSLFYTHTPFQIVNKAAKHWYRSSEDTEDALPL